MKNKLRCLLTIFPAALLVAITAAHAAETTLVSVDSSGVQGNNFSLPVAISSDGRIVVLCSLADNLVAGDTNGVSDIFVHDRVTAKTSRVSVDSGGEQGNNHSCGGEAVAGLGGGVSADGRFVVFGSNADNLVAGDTNGYGDAFVHDRLSGKTTRVSISSAGKQGNAASVPTAISADGRFVAFWSGADNLVAGDTNGYGDAFVRDRLSGKTTRVSISSVGKQGNADSRPTAISADGRLVVFVSAASNLVAGDTNGYTDAFVHDRLSGKTTRVSINSEGEQGNADSRPTAISADGRLIVFASAAYNLADGSYNEWSDAFVHDRVTGQTKYVSVDSAGFPGNDSSGPAAISADGSVVAIWSAASDLVKGDTNGYTDAFVRDSVANKTRRVSISSAGGQGNAASSPAAISADGRFVVFYSEATNLVVGNTNAGNVFIHDRWLNNSKAADLKVVVTKKPLSVPKGQIAHYTLTLKNNGPDSADNIALTDIVSNGAVTGMTPSQGTCSKAAISVCRIGTLAVGVSATVAVNIKANANPLKQQLSVSAAPKDSTPGNNTVTFSTKVTP